MPQLARGDICGDPTGLRVRVEDVDIHDYVRFSVIEGSDSGEDEAGSGQMSHVAFVSSLHPAGQYACSGKPPHLKNAHRNRPTIENRVGSLSDPPALRRCRTPCQVTRRSVRVTAWAPSLFASRPVQAHIPGRQSGHFLWHGLGMNPKTASRRQGHPPSGATSFRETLLYFRSRL
jgi:hypothetical protein